LLALLASLDPQQRDALLSLTRGLTRKESGG